MSSRLPYILMYIQYLYVKISIYEINYAKIK